MIAVVIGAAGGIGQVVSSMMMQRGYEVILAGRTIEKLNALQQTLSSQFPEGVCSSAQVNAEDADAMVSLLQQVQRDGEAKGTPLMAVVCCVGSILLKPAHATSAAEFMSVISANLVTAFNTVRAAGRTVSSGGAIVLVSSCAARIGLPNHEAIAAAKAGVEGLVRSAAATYAPKGIRINAVAPGLTRTPLSQRITASPQAEAASLALHPLRRLGEPQDIASAICYLCSSESSWVTGETLGVDGGLAGIKGV